MDFLRELFEFMRVRKKYWLIPILVALAVVGVGVALVGTGVTAAPFVYSLF